MKRTLIAIAVALALTGTGNARASDGQTIVDLDRTADHILTGRDFLRLPDQQQVAFLWGVAVGQQQGVGRVLGMLFLVRQQLAPPVMDAISQATGSYPHGCNCRAKDDCRAIRTYRNMRDMVVTYLRADDLRASEQVERIVDYALTDYCR